MSTRSAIGYTLPDGSIRAAYCHWDGGPEHQLPILKKHYPTTESVEALIRPGSMSSLRTELGWDRKPRDPGPLYHSERNPADSMGCETSPTLAAARLCWKRSDCEYLYRLSIDEVWKWTTLFPAYKTPRQAQPNKAPVG